MTMKVIRSEIPDIGARANQIDADEQLKAIVDGFMVPQLAAMAKVITELRNIVEALNKQVEGLAEKQRTINVHLDVPPPRWILDTWSDIIKENKGESTNQEIK